MRGRSYKTQPAQIVVAGDAAAAQQYAEAAEAARDEAVTQAGNAAASASDANASKVNAAASAVSAAASAVSAATSASNAATAATNAASDAVDAVLDDVSASVAAAATSASNAATSEANAAASAAAAAGVVAASDIGDLANVDTTTPALQEGYGLVYNGTQFVPDDRNKRPIVIFGTGQSNIASQPLKAWTPPSNLYIWDWENEGDNDIGTNFFPCYNNKLGLLPGFGEQVALANPMRKVLLINIGKGSQAIAQWKTGAASPDMYKACKQNVEAALALVGVSKIDYFVWWQGENDAVAGSTTYPADFETVITRFRGETWFPRDTPCIIMGMSTSYTLDNNLLYGNNWLRQVVAFEPETRSYVDTSVLHSGYWDAPTNFLHMTADGYRVAGEMAYFAAVEGRGQNRVRTPTLRVSKRLSTQRASTTTLAIDQELKVWLRSGRTYRVFFSIACYSLAAADFKYGWSHGTANLVMQKTRTLVPPTTAADAIGTGIPASNSLALSADAYFFIEGDFIVSSASVDGFFSFLWAQNTSNASPSYVFAGSYVEVTELR